MNLNDYFSEEEKIILNGQSIDLTKEEFLNKIDFNIQIIDYRELEVKELLSELKQKVAVITNKEWEDLQENYLPFELQSDSEVLEVLETV